MAELVDAQDLGSCDFVVRVRVPLLALGRMSGCGEGVKTGALLFWAVFGFEDFVQFLGA
jgi:hypothetical protein